MEDGLKRDENGKFVEGTAPGPGRPKGKSLKEYWKQRFSEMSEQEKEEFAKKVSPELLWQMAEGRPSAEMQVDATISGPALVRLDE